MTKEERLRAMAAPLLAWYDENKRDLPWRGDHPDPYQVWVSEIMLQQTRVAAVMPYYRAWMEELPTVEALAAADEERLMKLWQGLGYYSRARNLQRAARMIMENFGGRFPESRSDLLSLPGVGEYTAGAVASIAFGRQVPAVDGNVLRVAARVADIREDIMDSKVRASFQALMEAAMPADRPGIFNQALMDLGAMVCVPKAAPECGRCPLAELCEANRLGVQSQLPVRRKKTARRVEELTVYLLLQDGKAALRQREDRGLLAGLWEYPNELSPWPCPVEGKLEFAAAGKHIFTHKEWHMTAYTVEAEGEALPAGWVWADKAALWTEYAVPSAFQSFAHMVEERL